MDFLMNVLFSQERRKQERITDWKWNNLKTSRDINFLSCSMYFNIKQVFILSRKTIINVI